MAADPGSNAGGYVDAVSPKLSLSCRTGGLLWVDGGKPGKGLRVIHNIYQVLRGLFYSAWITYYTSLQLVRPCSVCCFRRGWRLRAGENIKTQLVRSTPV